MIIEAHRTQGWRALVGGYAVETVEDCVTETQTGFQRRRSEQAIDRGQLVESLASVHVVSDLERAELAVIVTRQRSVDVNRLSAWASDARFDHQRGAQAGGRSNRARRRRRPESVRDP